MLLVVQLTTQKVSNYNCTSMSHLVTRFDHWKTKSPPQSPRLPASPPASLKVLSRDNIKRDYKAREQAILEKESMLDQREQSLNCYLENINGIIEDERYRERIQKLIQRETELQTELKLLTAQQNRLRKRECELEQKEEELKRRETALRSKEQHFKEEISLQQQEVSEHKEPIDNSTTDDNLRSESESFLIDYLENLEIEPKEMIFTIKENRSWPKKITIRNKNDDKSDKCVEYKINYKTDDNDDIIDMIEAKKPIGIVDAKSGIEKISLSVYKKFIKRNREKIKNIKSRLWIELKVTCQNQTFEQQRELKISFVTK